MNKTIPKRIIQTGKSHHLTLTERAVVTNIRHLHPDFEYLYFDDDQVRAFVRDEYPQYMVTFDGFPKTIQRIDFFRYLAVHRLGGFYFDLDVLLARSVHDLLDQSCVFPFEELSIQPFLRERYGIDWEIGNYAFGAAPGHPFIGALIDNCIKAQSYPGWVAPMLQSIPRWARTNFEVLDTTGPGLVTRTWAEHRLNDADAVHLLFPDDVCDIRTWHQFGPYGVHLQAGGWRPKGGFWRRKFSLWWEQYARQQALLRGQRLGKRRQTPPVVEQAA